MTNKIPYLNSRIGHLENEIMRLKDEVKHKEGALRILRSMRRDYAKLEL